MYFSQLLYTIRRNLYWASWDHLIDLVFTFFILYFFKTKQIKHQAILI